MLKRISFSFVLALFLSFGLPYIGVFAQSVQECGDWDDVSLDEPRYEDMMDVCELNWIKGGGGKLNLDNRLKRIELVAIVNRVLGLTSNLSGESAYSNVSEEFTDVGEYDDRKDWMYRALDLGVDQTANFNQRFWKGYEDGSFRMLNDISFAEFSKLILFSFEKQDQLNGNFRLSQYNGKEWYSNYFIFLDSNGVLEFSGDEFVFEGDVYSVHDKMSRRETIRFIAKILERDLYGFDKKYELEGFEIRVPYYMDKSVSDNENLNVWKSGGDLTLTTVKVLRSLDTEILSEFVSVYVPQKFSSKVSAMYRVDRCNQADKCIRAFWIVLRDGNTLVLEGTFDKEKTAQGQRAVSDIVDSFVFD